MGERPKQAASYTDCNVGCVSFPFPCKGIATPVRARHLHSAHFLACTIGFVPCTSAMWQHSCVPLHHHDHRVQLLHAQRYLSEAGWHSRVDLGRPSPQWEPPVSIGRLFSRLIFQNVSGRSPSLIQRSTEAAVLQGCAGCVPLVPRCALQPHNPVFPPPVRKGGSPGLSSLL